MLRCPLCLGDEITLLERLAIADLEHFYRKKLRVSVIAEFGGESEISFYHCSSCDLKFFAPLREGSAAFYEKLRQLDWYYLTEKHEYSLARDRISQGDNVLDIGCGYGRFASWLSSVRYTGLEMSRVAAQLAAEQGLNVRYESVETHARQQPASYQVVCAFQVLEHVANLRLFIRASLECLSPGGLLIYSVPSANSFVADVRNAVLNLPPHHLTWWSDQCLENLAFLFGLQLVAIEHEPLAAIHKRWFEFNVSLQAISRLVGYRGPLLDRSLTFRLLSVVALPVMLWRMLRLSLSEVRPPGHSVIAVYRKLPTAGAATSEI